MATDRHINYIQTVAYQITREHNQFYTLTPYSSRESVLSISAWDYSAGYVDISDLTASKTQNVIVISSSIWSLKDFEEKYETLQSSNSLCRLQVSWGAEFYRYAQKILSFLENNGKLDLLIDRPLDAESIQEITALCQCHDVRLCLVVNRYFNSVETLKSLSPVLISKLVLNFPPPSNKNSQFCSPDEVIKAIDECALLTDLKITIFDNIIESQSDLKDAKFFLHLNREEYFSGTNLLEQYKTFRSMVLWMIRKNFVGLLDCTYAALMFVRKPSWQRFKDFLQFLWNSLRHKLAFGYQIFNFLKYRVPHVLRLYVYTPVMIIVRYRVPHFFRLYVYTPAMVFVRFRLPHFFRISLELLKLSYRVLFYPLYKIYWFSSFQFQKRILPFFRRGIREE